MASNREYWIKRMQHREAVSYTNGLEATAGLIRQYKKAASSIRKEINDFYARYAGENGLTFEQAMREMSRADLQEWRGTVGEYVRRIQQEPNELVRERLIREYDARSYNSRISRLDGLCGNVEMTVNNLYARADEQFRQLLGEEYTGGYYRAMYDLQTRLGYNGQFSTISREMVENTLAYPWSGANFSDRLWKNKTALVDTIRETLTQGMIRGDNIRDMSRAVADKLNSSFHNAERLVRTETSHIHNTAELAAYEAAGYEEYEFMASLGERTCEVCGGLDGQHFKISEKQFGVNFPPVHPNCRCTTVGWEPEEKELPEGEQREELSYEEWYGKYVEGREPVLIAEHQTAPALIAEHQTAPALIAEHQTAPALIEENSSINGQNNLTKSVKSGIIQTGKVYSFEEYLDNPKLLGESTPQQKYDWFINNGNRVIPYLRHGDFAKILYEDGGGYRVFFEENNEYMLQYHPAKRSHHGGAYYKLSFGKPEKKWFDLDGNEIINQ